MKFSLKERKTVIILVTTLLILITIPLAIFLVLQRQEIRKKAVGEPLVCDPGPVRYDSNTVTVTNNSGASINLDVQENICDYRGESIPLPFGTQCNQFFRRYSSSVPNGDTKQFSMNVPNCKIGQIDIIPVGVGCYNNRENKPWLGGMAFALKANSTGYNSSSGTCPQATSTPTPSPTGTPRPTNTPTPIPGSTSTPTPTRTPTPPPVGSVPTNTPTPTPTRTPTPTVPPGSTPTPTTPPPVSGNLAPTVLTILGGGLLLLVGLLL